MRIGIGPDTLSDRAVGAVRDLRSDIVPAAFAGVNANVFVGGTTAETLTSST